MARKITALIALLALLSSPAYALTRFYSATSLTGGGTGALDAIDGQGLADNDKAIVLTTTQVYFYYLDADSGASESSPDTISPDSNAGDKRWILIQSIVP